MASQRPGASAPDRLLKASEVESLSDLLADFLTDMDAFKGGDDQPTKEEATAELSPSRATENRAEVMEEEHDRKVSVGRKLKLSTRQRPSEAPSRKTSTHKRVRSASEQSSVSPKGKSTRGQPLPLLLLHREGADEQTCLEQGSVDDSSDWRRRKVPRLGTQAAWLLAPGLTLDEKVRSLAQFSVRG